MGPWQIFGAAALAFILVLLIISCIIKKCRKEKLKTIYTHDWTFDSILSPKPKISRTESNATIISTGDLNSENQNGYQVQSIYCISDGNCDQTVVVSVPDLDESTDSENTNSAQQTCEQLTKKLYA